MFGWRKKLLSSLNIKKQEKLLDKNKPVEVGTLISKRLFGRNNETDSYIGGKVTIDDKPFTEDEINTRAYERTMARQIKDKEPVMVELPSTAIASARFIEDEGKIYITYIGDDKEYVFRGNKNDWLAFMRAGSKGRHVQYIMRKYNQAPRSWY